MDSFEAHSGRKAVGVDKVSKADYAIGVEERIKSLSAKLRSLSYRPQPARRAYIPKSNGKKRPLGIPSFEDRIVQHRLSRILQAIWEPEFRNCSYGFRPHRNAHQALARVGEIVTNYGTQWIVEADIKGFFDHVSHDWMMRFLEHRIKDPVLLRIIRRFLKAGVMEDGVFTASETGLRKGDWFRPSFQIFTCIMCWIYGVRNAMPEPAKAGPIWCAMRTTMSRASRQKKMHGGSWMKWQNGWRNLDSKLNPAKRVYYALATERRKTATRMAANDHPPLTS